MITLFRLTRLAEEILFDLHWVATFELSETLEQEVTPTGRVYFYHTGGVDSGIVREHYISSKNTVVRYLQLPDGCICAPTFVDKSSACSKHVVNSARSIITNAFTADYLYFDEERRRGIIPSTFIGAQSSTKFVDPRTQVLTTPKAVCLADFLCDKVTKVATN